MNMPLLFISKVKHKKSFQASTSYLLHDLLPNYHNISNKSRVSNTGENSCCYIMCMQTKRNVHFHRFNWKVQCVTYVQNVILKH